MLITNCSSSNVFETILIKELHTPVDFFNKTTALKLQFSCD